MVDSVEMRWFIALLLFTFFSCSHGKKKELLTETDERMTEQVAVPTLRINKEVFTPLDSEFFRHSVGGEAIDQRTRVRMKYDDRNLILEIECLDDPWVDQNQYSEHNKPLFNQEVFEMFIAQGEEAPEQYWELQVNPNGAIFSGKVSNTYRSSKKFSMEMVDPTEVGIETKIEKRVEQQLGKGTWKIPLELIADVDQPMVFRMNMFRIISSKDHPDKKWSCNEENAVFACWNSTRSKKPSFHRPDYFGHLILE